LSETGILSLCSKSGEPYDLNEIFDGDPTDNELVDFISKIPLNKPRGQFYGHAQQHDDHPVGV
jgi:hypothetical protein